MFNLYHSLGKFSGWKIDDVFTYFSQKIGFDLLANSLQIPFSKEIFFNMVFAEIFYQAC